MPVETATVHPRGNPGEVGGRGPADHVVSTKLIHLIMPASFIYRDGGLLYFYSLVERKCKAKVFKQK